MKQKVLVILGQTATGKSDLAVRIARKLGGEVISADSRQVYKGLDIGTGKITQKEMRGVPHHLLGVASPKKRFTVAQYQSKAFRTMAEIIKRGKVPIICGGTGFYIDAVTKGIVLPAVPPNFRLRKMLSKKSAHELLVRLKKIDPSRAEYIDPNNSVRLIRAIEIAKALGRVPSLATKPLSYRFIRIGLHLPPVILRKRVEKRVKSMFKRGLLKEIKKLKKSGVLNKRLQELGFEYWQPTREKVIRATIKYAKRQMTWFRRDKTIKWFTDADVAFAAVPKLLEESRPPQSKPK